MYVRSIVIDGFKSYAQKTIINGFDREFNAITGLNGSGKSNILDAICFVLGITNLSQVRANQLQDLVYKSGQAGVTKASVSIVFDNTDKTCSPIGYNHCDEVVVTRQIVIGGRNKYLVNGVTCTNNKVMDMFRSVQLNVNNPHFLIMQGRITKVLNMKPPEILGMIEEAAGTKMYETKKQSAVRTIEKKEAKVVEITKILDEEINPQVERLRNDREQYVRYQKLQREVEQLGRINVAYNYVHAKESMKNSDVNTRTLEEDKGKYEKHLEENTEKVGALEEEIARLESQRDEQTGSGIGDMEGELTRLQTLHAQSESDLDRFKDSMKADEKKLSQMKKSVENDKKILVKKGKEYEEKEKNWGGAEEEGKRNQGDKEKAERNLEAVAQGMTTNEAGEATTLAAQIMKAKNEFSQLNTKTKEAEMKIKPIQRDLEKKRKDLSNAADPAQEQRNLDQLKLRINRQKESLSKLNFEEGSDQQLMAEQRQLVQQIRQLKNNKDNLEARFHQLQFEFQDPEPNFDRSKVKGLVAKLIRLPDPGHSIALEVTASDRLFNIIVDTEETGKKLLSKGQLRKRVTIIPLNKISARSISQDVVSRAKSLVGKENCHLALSLVGYDRELHKAMEYVFGNTLICNDMDQAKKVTFDKNILRTTVTLGGEKFSAEGVISGGARPQTASVLQQLNEMHDSLAELEEKENRLKEVTAQMQQIKQLARQYADKKSELEALEHEANLAHEKLQQTTYHQLQKDISELEQQIEGHRQTLNESEEKRPEIQKKLQDLEAKSKNSKKYQEEEMKKAKKWLEDVKKRIAESQKVAEQSAALLETLRQELRDIESSIAEEETKIVTLSEKIQEDKEKVRRKETDVQKARVAMDQQTEKINKKKEVLKAKNKEISQKHNAKELLEKDSRATELKIQQTGQDIQKAAQDLKAWKTKVDELKKKNAWIADDERHFGVKDTAYDFELLTRAKPGEKLEDKQQELEHLRRNVNMRAMNMLNKAEENALKLQADKDKLNSDKMTLMDTIKELDELKKKTIIHASDRVNQDGPKVAFGDVWKESLAELSGGQRSLVALSLVLAMLKFKPAPIYILDEVDAALDLSHTQNIGSMIKRYFTASQFIVVSLKDGMFNNANVLFKTKFVDGCSTVSRHTQPRVGVTNGNNTAAGRAQDDYCAGKENMRT